MSATSSNTPQAPPLVPVITRVLGIGHSTGLDMAPILIDHPVLFNNWIIARVRSLPPATAAEKTLFQDLLARSQTSAGR